MIRRAAAGDKGRTAGSLQTDLLPGSPDGGLHCDGAGEVRRW